MKRILLTAINLLAFFISSSQIVNTTATYTSGPIGIQWLQNPSTNSISTCADTLLVSIPNGNYIYGVSVEYSLNCTNPIWNSDLWSYLDLPSHNKKEATIYQGVGNFAGTQAYNRSNLVFANGIAASGQLKFVLQVFKTFGPQACNTSNSRVLNNTFKVTVQHGPPPSCLPPTNPQVEWVMSDKARLNWIAGSATSWQVEYGAPGFTLGNGTRVTANTNPFVLSGLSPNTTYEFYVRDSCGVGNVSIWSPSVNFSTLCSPAPAPYLETFDATAWMPGTGIYNANNAIAPCWQRNPQPTGVISGPYAWGTASGPTQSANTGPSADNTTGTGKYVYTEANNGANGSVAALTSQLINLVPLNTPELEFYYHMFGFSTGQLQVEVWNKTLGWQTVFTKTGQQQTASTAPWIKENILLPAYANDTILVRFRATRGFTALGDIAIDDFRLKEGPTCLPPSNLTLVSLGLGSATLNWTAATATNWDIQYGLSGFTLGSGTIVNATSRPFTVSGLTGGGNYSFYVRERCGATDTSVWIGPLTIPIPCSPINAPFSENFNGAGFTGGTGIYNTGDALATCFLRYPAAGTNAQSPYYWGIRQGPPSTAGTGPASGNGGAGRYAYTESSAGTQGQQALFIIPTLNLATLNVPELRFWYHMFGAGMGSLSIDVQKVGGALTSNVFTLTGQQTIGRNAAWKEAIVNLSSFAGDTVIIIFRGTRGINQTSDIAIDDITVQNAPTCPVPTNLAANVVTSSAATLSWTSGGATNWNIAYGPIGFTPGATFTSTNQNPSTISGLSPNTTYHVYVRDSCAVGDVSLWVGPLVITTGCAPAIAPFTENFDGPAWTVGANFAPGTIDNCWQRSATTVYWFKPRQGATPSQNTGPSADNTSGTGKYIYTETSNGGTTTSITSPEIDLSPLSVPELSFFYHMYGALINSLTVEVSNGGPWTIVATITGQQQTSSADLWKKQTINLSAYANDTIRVRFMAQRNAGAANTVDISIDDFDIHEAPSCPQPFAFSASNITSNAVTLSWTTGGATNWNIAYGPIGFTPGASFTSTNQNPITITGLTPNTAYHFYVRDSCDTSDVSLWVGPLNVFTGCVPLNAPWTENFDGAAWTVDGNFAPGAIGSCWARSDSTVYWWKPRTGPTPSVNTGPSGDNTSGSGKYMYTETSNGGTTTSLTTPVINLSPLTNPELTFWYHMYGALINKLDVQVNNGTGWNTIFTLTGQQQNAVTAAWKEAIIPLTAYANDTIQVRFLAQRNAGANNQVDIAIDDIDIHEAPACPKPTSIITSNATSNSIQVAWNTGGATNWQIEYGPAGFAIGSGTIVNAATNPFTVSGLLPNTIYGFYVRDSCGIGSVSNWEGPSSDTTLCGVIVAPYTENFDGPTWVATAGGFTAGEIDNCWIRSSIAQFWWRPRSGPTPTPNTGPSGDHTSGIGKYIHTESNTGSTSAFIESPQISLTALTDPQMRFWYHMYGALITNLIVQVSNGGPWVAVDTIVGQQQTSQTSLWLERVIDLSNFVDDTIKIRFVGNKQAGNANTADICIDDLKVIEKPSCNQPTNFTATTSTTNSVTLNWTTGGAIVWQVEYGPVGFQPGNGTLVNAATNPFTVTGLSASQQYDFYVRDSCGIGVVSFWTGPIRFGTQCGTVLAPYYENFDFDFLPGTGLLNDSSTISNCWTRNPDSAYHWGGGPAPVQTFGTGTQADHTSGFGRFVYVESTTSPSGSIATLETPFIDLSPITDPELRFWYHMWAANGTQGKLIWEIWSNNVWIKLDSMSGNQGNAWQEKVVSLSNYANQVIKIRFWAQKGTGPTPQQGDIAIDDLSIVPIPNCPPPSLLGALATTTTSITLGWSPGGGNSWQIEFDTAGFTPGLGAVINTTNNPHTISGLNMGTSYDFYIRDNCGINGFSNWVGPLNASTLMCPPVSAAITFSATGLTYSFDASASGPNATSYAWDFGDGNNAIGVNPTHTYATGGSFIVTLIVLNNCGSTDTLVQTIIACPLITASFTYTSIGLAFTFDASASGPGATSYSWNFGDGTQGSGVNPTHTYAGGTSYTITLIVANNCGNSDTITQIVTPCVPISGSFSYTATGLTVNFDGTAIIGTGLTYNWNFGDGNNGTGQNPVHTYAANGNYTVSVTVLDACGQSNTISISISACAPLGSSFSWTQSGLNVNFTATTSGAITWSWQFGDGTSDINNPTSHTYSASGTYQVQLTITNLCGQSADTTITITVCQPPTANWTYNIIQSNSSGMIVQFDGTASIGANSFLWDFGDGTTNNTSATPIHTYNIPGLFWIVTLKVTNICNETSTLKSSLASIGIDETTAKSWMIYPNPASHSLFIVSPHLITESIHVRIINASGSLVYNQRHQSNGEIELDITNLPQGHYTIELENSNGSGAQRLIINR